MKALWGGCLLLLVLPVGLAAQHVAIGPQVVFGDYREVSSDLHYRGAGIGAKATLEWKKFSADIALSKVKYKPTSDGTATAEFDIIAAPASVPRRRSSGRSFPRISRSRK